MQASPSVIKRSVAVRAAPNEKRGFGKTGTLANQGLQEGKKRREARFLEVCLVCAPAFHLRVVGIYRLMSVRGRQNLKCLPKIVPRAKQGKIKCKQTPEDVLRTMTSLGSG